MSFLQNKWVHVLIVALAAAAPAVFAALNIAEPSFVALIFGAIAGGSAISAVPAKS